MSPQFVNELKNVWPELWSAVEKIEVGDGWRGLVLGWTDEVYGYVRDRRSKRARGLLIQRALKRVRDGDRDNLYRVLQNAGNIIPYELPIEHLRNKWGAEAELYLVGDKKVDIPAHTPWPRVINVSCVGITSPLHFRVRYDTERGVMPEDARTVISTITSTVARLAAFSCESCGASVLDGAHNGKGNRWYESFEDDNVSGTMWTQYCVQCGVLQHHENEMNKHDFELDDDDKAELACIEGETA